MMRLWPPRSTSRCGGGARPTVPTLYETTCETTGASADLFFPKHPGGRRRRTPTALADPEAVERRRRGIRRRQAPRPREKKKKNQRNKRKGERKRKRKKAPGARRPNFNELGQEFIPVCSPEFRRYSATCCNSYGSSYIIIHVSKLMTI